MKQDRIVILDLGGQASTEIARAVRALGVYSEIRPHDITPAALRALPNLKGLILCGTHHPLMNGGNIDVDEEIYKMGLPVLAFDHPAAQAESLPLPQGEALQERLRTFIFDLCGA